MARNKDSAPATPDVERLEEIIERWNSRAVLEVRTEEESYMIECLEWLVTFLRNRKGYHRRTQLRKKFLIEYAERVLGPEEMQAINNQVNQTHFEEVANELPDASEIEEIITNGGTE